MRSKILLLPLFVITIKLTLWSANLSLSHSDSFAVKAGDHLRSRIICSPFWGSFAAWGSFGELYGTYLSLNIRELKQRRRRRQRERQKSNRFQIGKTTTLHVHRAFLHISLPPLHDYNVKVPNFTFCRGRERRQQLSFSFPWLWHSPLEFHSKKNCQHLTNLTRPRAITALVVHAKRGLEVTAKHVKVIFLNCPLTPRSVSNS